MTAQAATAATASATNAAAAGAKQDTAKTGQTSAVTVTKAATDSEVDSKSTEVTKEVEGAKSADGGNTKGAYEAAPTASMNGKKDIRKHSKYSLSYEVSKYNELYTLVERLGGPDKAQGFVKRTKAHYRELRRQLPLLWRFTKETLPPVGKRRIALYLLGDFLKGSIIPIAQARARYDLAELTIMAIQTRELDVIATARVILQDIASFVLGKAIETKLDNNKAKIAYRYSTYIRERIIEHRLRLDSVTSANEKVIGQIRSAQKLLARSWDSSFFLTQISGVVSDMTNLINNFLMIRKVTKKHNSTLGLWSFLIGFAITSRRYIGYLSYGSRHVTAITDDNFRRTDIMDRASHDANAQDQVLGLRHYYYQEYKKARDAVGDASPNEPDVWQTDSLHPWRALFFKTIDKVNSSALYILFALRTIRQPPNSMLDASSIINDLNLLQSSAQGCSYTIYHLLYHLQKFFDNLNPVEKYYSLEHIRPLLKQHGESIRYMGIPLTHSSSPATEPLLLEDAPSTAAEMSPTTAQADEIDVAQEKVAQTSKPCVASGMSIEFQNVSFTYPHKYKKALDSVSFKIEAGQLCSIVGFSGSGKSTLIALLVRLHDPDEGTILINGINIAHYDPDTLYENISYLFQTTAKPNLTIREFIKLGRLDATESEIEQAVKDSGADEIINKFSHGIDTELAARHLWDRSVSVEMLVKRAQQIDEGEMRWRGKQVVCENDEDDSAEDDRTDEEHRKILESCMGAYREDQAALSDLEKWKKKAAREELPAPSGDEEAVLTEGFDPKKAEEEERKNQSDMANFSGGEWAKIVLARSFLRNSADLLILDEYSAALDPLSEANIFSKFLERRGLRTIIAVTHRFHLACKSDIILFMAEGQLKESGSHHDLMKLDGKYKEMYNKTTNSSGKEVSTQTEPEEGELNAEDAKEPESTSAEKAAEGVETTVESTAAGDTASAEKEG